MDILNRIFQIIKGILGIFVDPFRSRYTKERLTGQYFEIGDFTYGVPNVFHYDQDDVKLVIGKFCSISENVKIFLSGNHRIDWISTYPFKSFSKCFPSAKQVIGHPASKGNVVIGNDVWIGHSSIILSGVSIADGAVIAASSVVTKNVGAYEIWGGNPARFIKKRFTETEIKILLQIEWWNWDVNKINKNMSLICNSEIKEFLERFKEINKYSNDR